MKKNYKFLGVLAFILAGSPLAFGQIKGTVQEADGSPSYDAKVEIKGTNVSTRTDENGSFELSTAKAGDVLVISDPLGDEKKEVKASNNLVFKFTKKEQVLEGVTITGAYGIRMTPEQSVGSFSRVDTKDLEKPDALSVDLILAGRAAGVDVSAGSGQPGTRTATFIRGLNSITGSAQPLYIVDGIPILTGDAAGVATTSNALAMIDPAIIESVDILKDAAATSIYGTRAANGVIVITTKNARKGQNKFQFTSEVGFSKSAYEKFDMLSASEHIDLYTRAIFNKGGYTTEAEAREAAIKHFRWDGSTNADWVKATRRDFPISTRNVISYQGGTENIQLMSSLGYTANDGVANNAYYNRLSGTLKASWKISDKANIVFSNIISRANQSGPSDGSTFANPVFAARIMSPTQPIKVGEEYNTNLVFMSSTFNPVAIQNTNKTISQFSKLISSFNFTWEFAKNFRFVSSPGVDWNFYDEYEYWNPNFGDGYNGEDETLNGMAFKYDRTLTTWNWSNFVHYSNTLAEKHALEISAGIEATNYLARSFQAEGVGIPFNPKDTYYQIGIASEQQTAAGKNAYDLVGYVGRLAYTYDKFVSLAGSFRRDGYSGFGEDRRYGDFWSGGLAFNLEKLGLFNYFNELKLRASYGEVGNSGITVGSYYKSLGVFSLSPNSLYGGASGGTYIPGNPELQWETSQRYNIGLDYAFANNRIKGSVEVYKNNNIDQLFDIPTAPSTGTTVVFGNGAHSISKGVEATLTVEIVKKEKFNWTLSANYAFNESIIKKLTGDTQLYRLPNSYVAYAPDHHMSEYYMRIWAGVDPINGDPLWWTDASRTDVTNDATKAQLVLVGQKSMPSHILGVSNVFNIGDFLVSFLFQYKGNYAVYDPWAFVYASDGTYVNQNQVASQLYDSWTPENPYASNPKVVNGGNKNSTALSTRDLYRGDHIRLKSLELGYRLKGNKVGIDGIESVYFYTKGTNLWTWAFDKNLYFDPEAFRTSYSGDLQGLGIYDQTQPIFKEYSFGVIVNF
ncbi:MAG: SusC/RagA family TonB-linked outer membrane protein [Flavobacteriaceae bacterium]|jgi:TonB-linked SusC/RagA family outer membrane protein|nr:SusC/RagA family TonB-linked outer membrane protein [Flavobacteriaceae bacterium]